MGEFPEQAIHGDPVPITTFEPVSSESWTSLASAPSDPLSTLSSTGPPVEPTTIHETTETTMVVETSTRLVTSVVLFTSKASGEESKPSRHSSSSTVFTAFEAQPRPSTLAEGTSITTSRSTPSPSPTASTTHTLSSFGMTARSTSLSSTSTRPITTPIPVPTYTPRAPTELVSPNPHLSFGEIVGVVLAVTITLGLFAFCLVIGPRHAMNKVGAGREPGEAGVGQLEDGDGKRDEGGTMNKSGSDWWNLRAPAGALGTRLSSQSVGGPGLAGVGAGGRTVQDPGTSPRAEEQASEYGSSGSASRRSTVRSGWFVSSMVRGASLLSLGSLLRPEPTSAPAEQGSAGRRFQELYRRDRASEMGGRVPYPPVTRPSRLGAVPTILVQEPTLARLSSESHVTGHGYDADVERV